MFLGLIHKWAALFPNNINPNSGQRTLWGLIPPQAPKDQEALDTQIFKSIITAHRRQQFDLKTWCALTHSQWLLIL